MSSPAVSRIEFIRSKLSNFFRIFFLHEIFFNEGTAGVLGNTYYERQAAWDPTFRR